MVMMMSVSISDAITIPKKTVFNCNQKGKKESHLANSKVTVLIFGKNPTGSSKLAQAGPF